MTTLPQSESRLSSWNPRDIAPAALAAVAAAVLFARPAALLGRDWWNDPEAGHGLLLAPLAVWLAWRRGLASDRTPSPVLGAVILLAAVALRYLGGLAAELFTMRFSIVVALAGLTVFAWGLGQLRRWWLPAALLALSVPIPALVTNALALPLQFKASSMGATLLEWRHVPVQLAGNVIDLPGRRLFVTEACSGLRSLTALLSLGVLIGGLWLRSVPSRLLLIGLAIPVAIAVNAVRVFMTGFLVYFVDPKLGEGFMHLTEGWLLFVVAFVILGGTAWLASAVERRWYRRRAHA
ncbi:MAG: exosortase/archaeosortase family protein [Gemmatimonadales bacterium]